jgi:hypothetical protein
MDPFYRQAIGVIVRQILGYAGFAGTLSDDEFNRLVGALAMLVTIGWSLWQKYQAAQAAAPPPLPPPSLPILKHGKRDR